MEILVLHTGGTIACEQTNGSLAPSANITPILKEIAKEFKGLRFTQKRITPFLSECLNGNHLTKIATELQKALNKGSYVGAIVTHGSDTIAYTSAFLSYIFGASSLPIVTVCADLPLSDKNSSGHLNLRAATALILSNQACGVFSVYKDTDSSAIIHRGSRLLRHRAYESQLTSTAAHYGKAYLIAPENWKITKSPLYCEADDGIIFDIPRLKKNSEIQYLTVYPGMLFPSLPRGCAAVILGSYHSGTVDTSNPQTVKFAKHCKKRGIPVFIDGIGANADYASMKEFEKLGFARLLPLVSPCAMYIKLWLLVTKGEKELSQMLSRSCGGDVVPMP